jgi:predicted ester cyclase
MTDTAAVVATFLARVRVTGDPAAAAEVMGPLVDCHQMVSETPETVRRTPAQYAEHVREMLAAFGRFRYTVTEFLVDGDRVYVRWRQDGHHLLTDTGKQGTGQPVTDLGSAVYRVAQGKIVEYWIQLDRLGLQRQVDRLLDQRRGPTGGVSLD